MSIYKNEKLVAGGRQVTPLLSFMWADHILDDISWLRADTFSWQSGSVYQAVYQHLVDDIDGKTPQSETIGATTIWFYLADDGHKIVPGNNANLVEDIYNATGVAWYYILDTVNQRFKLPRTKFGFIGLRDNAGKYVEPTLPNIKGTFDTGDRRTHITGTSGALYNNTVSSGQWAGTSSATGNTQGVGFDASRSNSIYKNNATVQPPATQMYLYFYVGVFTQTALENTAGIVSEDFNELNQHKVIEFQAPTAENNYTWYRKYADGWVEQGGARNGYDSISGSVMTKNLMIAMQTPYNATLTVGLGQSDTGAYWARMTTESDSTHLKYYMYLNNSVTTNNPWLIWEVRGMAA